MFKTHAINLLLALLFVGCNSNNQKKTNHENVSNSLEQGVVMIKKDSVYKATYELGKTLEIEVDHSESASLSKVTITSKGFNLPISVEMETDPVTDFLMADLDENGFKELYLMTTSAGSGSYGTVYAFISEKNEKIVQTSLLGKDTTNEPKFKGHMGHDAFFIEDGYLVQEFPVYEANDPNAKPTGGKRKVFYKLKNNELILTDKR